MAEEQELLNGYRAMAMKTGNGKAVLPYIEKQGYKYRWTDGTKGGIDPTEKFINIPRRFWQDAAWTMIHEGVHVVDLATGKYSSDKGWQMWRMGEVRAYGAEIKAYLEYQASNPGYETPQMQAILWLWNRPKEWDSFIWDTYRPGWERLTGEGGGKK